MMKLNGKQVPVSKEFHEISLLDFIRDQVLLKGTKYGCGQGLCGACTIHLDGIARRACQLNVADVVGHEVTTIEGLAETSGRTGSDDLHPVQKAWIEEAVPQCGYCQPGQIMTAAALLRETPQPDAAQIRTGMNGNICRCGTYERIHRAVARAAREDQS